MLATDTTSENWKKQKKRKKKRNTGYGGFWGCKRGQTTSEELWTWEFWAIFVVVVVVVVVICFGSEYVWRFLCWAQTRGVNRFGRKKKGRRTVEERNRKKKKKKKKKDVHSILGAGCTSSVQIPASSQP